MRVSVALRACQYHKWLVQPCAQGCSKRWPTSPGTIVPIESKCGGSEWYQLRQCRSSNLFSQQTCDVNAVVGEVRSIPVSMWMVQSASLEIVDSADCVTARQSAPCFLASCSACTVNPSECAACKALGTAAAPGVKECTSPGSGPQLITLCC